MPSGAECRAPRRLPPGPYGRSAQHRTRRREPGQRGIGREAARSGRRPPRWLPIALLAVVLGVGGAAFLLTLPRPGEPVAWSRLGTQDVHSLAFVRDDAGHLLFGHHNGIAESRDGGRTWTPLPLRDDAMGMSAAGDGSIVIAGHEVFRASRDGGKTWAPIDADLPSLDIHGFAGTRGRSEDVGVPRHGRVVGEHRLRGTLDTRP